MTLGVIGIISGVLAGTGFWQFLLYVIQNKKQTDSAQSRMLLGLAHDKICWLSKQYISRGSITAEEYENLVTYLYLPYKEMGGNGTAERLILEVKKLPIS